MKHPCLFMIMLFTGILFSNCKKDEFIKKGIQQNQENSQTSKALLKNFAARYAGVYKLIGKRVLYNVHIADSSVASVVDLSIVSPKGMFAIDQNTLGCDYAELGGISGWQYIISYDENTNQFDVQPNEVMAANITPGSWKVYDVQFNPHTKTFYLKTGYTNTVRNDRLVEETLVKEDAQFYIGERYGGGIIFYIDSTGEHGLIADTVDLRIARWWNRTYITTGATETAIYKGSENTQKINLYQSNPTSFYAASICATSNGSGYTDWYLPSKDELNEIYIHKIIVGVSGVGAYWSSTESSNVSALAQSFFTGQQIVNYDKSFYNQVRAIRSF